MFRRFKSIFRTLKIQSNQQTDYEAKINEYRKSGIKIGEKCFIYSSLPRGRDCFLLEIGNNVTISAEVGFINHDNAIIIPSKGVATDLLGRIVIGDNCFIGYRSTICPGVVLADNTIVGMGSVVTKSVMEPGYVIAGNPARIICRTEEYMEKNRTKMINLNGMSQKEIEMLVHERPDLLICRQSIC